MRVVTKKNFKILVVILCIISLFGAILLGVYLYQKENLLPKQVEIKKIVKFGENGIIAADRVAINWAKNKDIGPFSLSYPPIYFVIKIFKKINIILFFVEKRMGKTLKTFIKSIP